MQRKNVKQLLTQSLLLTGMVLGMAIALRGQSQLGWEFYYGGDSEDQGQAILQTDDRGYIIAGYSESFGSDNDFDVYVIRTDVDGDLIWENVYDEGFREFGHDIEEAHDGGYIIAGSIAPTPLDLANGYLIHIGPNGEFLWSQSYGGPEFDQFWDVEPTSDGGYIMTGRTFSSGAGGSDIYVVKTDGQGNTLWEKTFGSVDNDDSRSIIEISGGYVLAGSFGEATGSNADIYLLKLDFSGEIADELTIPNPGTFDQTFEVIEAADGNFVLTGHLSNIELYIAKISQDFDLVLWDKTFTNGIGMEGHGLVEAEDGNYVIVGFQDLIVQGDIIAVKVDQTTGDEIWVSNYGRPTHLDWAEAIVKREDGGFAIAGYNALATQVFFNDVTLIKMDADGKIRTNTVSGTIFYDINNDLTQDAGEPGLQGWIVEAESPNITYYGSTDAQGNYTILVDTGVYEVRILAKNPKWEATIPVYNNVGFTGIYGNFPADFPVQAVYFCPSLVVNASAASVTPCTDINYTVQYRNDGPTQAENAEVTIELDEHYTFQSASLPVASQIGDSIFVFDLGTVAAGALETFTLTVNASCDALIGEAFQLTARIAPNDDCLPDDPTWDGSSVRVTGKCSGDEVEFVLSNIGTGSMTQEAGYIVIEDDIMGYSNPFQLPSAAEMTVKRAANGSTYRIVAAQTEGHPGRSFPTVSVEGCVAGGGTDYSTGMVTMFQEDEADPFVCIDVQESIESSEWVDLRGYPKGYRGDTIAANTDIKYHIRFQNTGADTAHWLVIRDTLPLEWLDIATLEAGASSHPYQVQVYDYGIVKFVFDNIELPPSDIDPQGSVGFVQFTISQKPNNPAGTEILNQALAYVGYTTPAGTAEKRHVIGGATLEDFVEITTDTKEPLLPNVSLNIFPNPFNGSTTIRIDGQSFGQLQLLLFDVQGNLIRTQTAAGAQMEVQRNQLPAGTYFFQLNGDGQLIQTGKVVVQ